MDNRAGVIIPAIILIILGIIMIYLGASGPKLILPPIITGLGFFVIAWAFIKK